MFRMKQTLPLLLGAWIAGCTPPSNPTAAPGATVRPDETWVLAIHGGAGTIDPDAPAEEQQAYRDALERALAAGRDLLAAGRPALDAVETVVRQLEDDPLFNAGRGAVFNERGEHELDAAIMDGSTMACGAVAGVRTIRHPITLARRVMEGSGHVLLVGEGAEQYADAIAASSPLERVPNTYFDTPKRRAQLDERLRQRAAAEAEGKSRGTVGAVALDRDGRLAAATSTGGLTAKRYGRVGDSPVIGAGTYANSQVAVSCTGTGEEFIRHAVAKDLAARYEYLKLPLQQAADQLVFEVLKPDDGGLIAVSRSGEVATPFSSPGMYRGVATSSGRFEVRIFADR